MNELGYRFAHPGYGFGSIVAIIHTRPGPVPRGRRFKVHLDAPVGRYPAGNPRGGCQASGFGSITLAMYRAVTRNIEVSVTPRFLEERSSPSQDHFFWAYTIEIANRGEETVQLKSRHWRITDALGRMQEVRGAGVVGEEPVIEPGESFEYTSGVPLTTPSGFMVGSYGMVTAEGERFEVEIPAFSLDSSEGRRVIN